MLLGKAPRRLSHPRVALRVPRRLANVAGEPGGVSRAAQKPGFAVAGGAMGRPGQLSPRGLSERIA
jgi:hypothetical protein